MRPTSTWNQCSSVLVVNWAPACARAALRNSEEARARSTTTLTSSRMSRTPPRTCAVPGGPGPETRTPTSTRLASGIGSSGTTEAYNSRVRASRLDSGCVAGYMQNSTNKPIPATVPISKIGTLVTPSGITTNVAAPTAICSTMAPWMRNNCCAGRAARRRAAATMTSSRVAASSSAEALSTDTTGDSADRAAAGKMVSIQITARPSEPTSASAISTRICALLSRRGHVNRTRPTPISGSAST